MQDGMRADPVPAGPWMWGGALDPFLRGQTSGQPPYCPLYLLHSVSWLRGWQGRGGGLKVRGYPARAVVDGLGEDGMESMEWRAGLVMWMRHGQGTWMEEGSVHVGTGKSDDGSGSA